MPACPAMDRKSIDRRQWLARLPSQKMVLSTQRPFPCKIKKDGVEMAVVTIAGAHKPLGVAAITAVPPRGHERGVCCTRKGECCGICSTRDGLKGMSQDGACLLGQSRFNPLFALAVFIKWLQVHATARGTVMLMYNHHPAALL